MIRYVRYGYSLEEVNLEYSSPSWKNNSSHKSSHHTSTNQSDSQSLTSDGNSSSDSILLEVKIFYDKFSLFEAYGSIGNADIRKLCCSLWFSLLFLLP